MRLILSQVISAKKKPAPPIMRGRTGSAGMTGMFGIPEEGLEEWEGPVGVARVEERVGLAGEIGAVVMGLSQFKAELLQLHAIVSYSGSDAATIALQYRMHCVSLWILGG